MCREMQPLQRLDLIAQILSDQVEERCAQLDDLLVRETFTFQLSVEALGYGLVSVQVQFFGVFISHFTMPNSVWGRGGCVPQHSKCRATY